MRTSDRAVAAGLFALVLLTYAWFDGGTSWNSAAHLATARALVERGTFHIDGYDGATRDVATGIDGRTYANKPPGVSLLAAVPYGAIHLVSATTPETRPVHERLVTVATASLCGALIAVVLYLYGRRSAFSARASLAVALVVAFGTIVFAYSTVLFAHVPAALLLLLAFAWRDERPFLAGMAAGAATFSYLLAAVGVVVLTVDLVVHSRRSAFRFVAGGVPFAVLLGWYQNAFFGAPWRMALEASAGFTDPGLTLGLLRLPSPQALYGITVSPYRGLFFSAPVLLLAIPGLLAMKRRGRGRDAAVVAASAILSVVVVSSFNGWYGGHAFGARYLLAIVPLLAIPMLFVTARWRAGWIALGMFSVACNFLAVAVDPATPTWVRNPLLDYHLPVFLHARMPPSPWPEHGEHTRRQGHVSTAIGADNLGELLFAPGTRATVLPIVVWMAAGGLLLFRAAKRVDLPPGHPSLSRAQRPSGIVPTHDRQGGGKRRRGGKGHP